MRRVWLFVVLALVVGLSSTASANGFLPTEQECREGSDFIKNAVLSRANGYSKAFLLGRFDDDMTVLSGMHPEKRWFVRSQGAMQFLRQALIDAIAAKRKPRDQADIFLRSCMAHVSPLTPADL